MLVSQLRIDRTLGKEDKGQAVKKRLEMMLSRCGYRCPNGTVIQVKMESYLLLCGGGYDVENMVCGDGGCGIELHELHK